MEKIKAEEYESVNLFTCTKSRADCKDKALKLPLSLIEKTDVALPETGAELGQALEVALRHVYVAPPGNKGEPVIIEAETEIYDHLDKLLQKIQQMINEYSLQKRDYIVVIIQDTVNLRKNTFKIWKNLES